MTTNTVKTALLLGLMSGVLLLLGEALGGAPGLMFGFIFAAVTNFASYWFSGKIVLAMYAPARWGRVIGCTSSWRGWLSAPTCRCRRCT